MNSLIITHPGKAHFDEFLAISLILASDGEDTRFTIERRNPTEEELDDPDVWVIDIGERHEPNLRNFDHHQDLDLPVSFVLVADHLGLTETLCQYPWWSFKDRIDRFGPLNVAREMGVETIAPAYSPFESWFLTLFQDSPVMVYHLMYLFGRSLLEEAEKLSISMKFWEGCEVVQVRGKRVMIGLTDDSTGAQLYCDGLEDPPDISLTYDNRGEGWKIFRFNGCECVDFSVLENRPEMIFAHKGGFVAKTKKRIPLSEVLKLIGLAVTQGG